MYDSIRSKKKYINLKVICERVQYFAYIKSRVALPKSMYCIISLYHYKFGSTIYNGIYILKHLKKMPLKMH